MDPNQSHNNFFGGSRGIAANPRGNPAAADGSAGSVFDILEPTPLGPSVLIGTAGGGSNLLHSHDDPLEPRPLPPTVNVSGRGRSPAVAAAPSQQHLGGASRLQQMRTFANHPLPPNIPVAFAASARQNQTVVPPATTNVSVTGSHYSDYGNASMHLNGTMGHPFAQLQTPVNPHSQHQQPVNPSPSTAPIATTNPFPAQRPIPIKGRRDSSTTRSAVQKKPRANQAQSKRPPVTRRRPSLGQKDLKMLATVVPHRPIPTGPAAIMTTAVVTRNMNAKAGNSAALVVPPHLQQRRTTNSIGLKPAPNVTAKSTKATGVAASRKSKTTFKQKRKSDASSRARTGRGSRGTRRKFSSSKSKGSSAQQQQQDSGPKLRILDEFPGRLVNPLLEAFVPGVEPPSRNDPPLMGSELLAPAQLAFYRPDTYPISFLGRILGFDIPIPGPDTQKSDFPITIDPKTVPVARHSKLDPAQHIPTAGRRPWRKVGVCPIGDEDDQHTMERLDPVYRQFLLHGVDKRALKTPVSSLMAQFSKHIQQLRRSKKWDNIVTMAKETAQDSKEFDGWDIIDWNKFSALSHNCNNNDSSPSSEINDRNNSDPNVDANDTTTSSTDPTPKNVNNKTKRTHWTTDGESVFSTLAASTFGIVARHEGVPKYLLTYSFQWSQMAPDALGQIESELIMVIHGVAEPTNKPDTASKAKASYRSEEMAPSSPRRHFLDAAQDIAQMSSTRGLRSKSAQPNIPISPSTPGSVRQNSSTIPAEPQSPLFAKKKSTIPPETVEYLKRWMMSPKHINHPYPNEEEKLKIINDTGIEPKKLQNWFVNSRQRYWKPRMKQKTPSESTKSASTKHPAATGKQKASQFTPTGDGREEDDGGKQDDGAAKTATSQENNEINAGSPSNKNDSKPELRTDTNNPEIVLETEQVPFSPTADLQCTELEQNADEPTIDCKDEDQNSPNTSREKDPSPKKHGTEENHPQSLTGLSAVTESVAMTAIATADASGGNADLNCSKVEEQNSSAEGKVQKGDSASLKNFDYPADAKGLNNESAVNAETNDCQSHESEAKKPESHNASASDRTGSDGSRSEDETGRDESASPSNGLKPIMPLQKKAQQDARIASSTHMPAGLSDPIWLVMVSMALEHARCCDVWYSLFEAPPTMVKLCEWHFRMVQIPMRRKQVDIPMVCDLKKCSYRFTFLQRERTVPISKGPDDASISNRERAIVRLPCAEIVSKCFGLDAKFSSRNKVSATRRQGNFFAGASVDMQKTAFVAIRADLSNADEPVLSVQEGNDKNGRKAISWPTSGATKRGKLKIEFLKSFQLPANPPKALDDVDNDADDELLKSLTAKQEELKRLEGDVEPTVRSLLSKAIVLRENFEKQESRLKRLDEKRILSENQKLIERRKEMDLAWQKQLEQDMDAVCTICDDGEVTPDNQILFCEACNVPVHQFCYGVEQIPDGDYYCVACRHFKREKMSEIIARKMKRNVLPTTKITPPPLPICCELCPIKQGAFIRTSPKKVETLEDGSVLSKWVHNVCAKWQGLNFLNSGDPEVVEDVSELKTYFLRLNIRCSICNGQRGAYQQCRLEGCSNYCHVTCARMSGLCEVIHGEDFEGPVDVNPWTLLCPQHSVIGPESLKRDPVPVEHLIRASKEFPPEPKPAPLPLPRKPFNKLNGKERKKHLADPDYEAGFYQEMITKKLAGVRCEVCDQVEEDGKNLSRCVSCLNVICVSCTVPEGSETERNVICIKCQYVEGKTKEGVKFQQPKCNLCVQKGGWLLEAFAKPVNRQNYWSKNPKEYQKTFFAQDLWCHNICAFWHKDILVDYVGGKVDCTNVIMSNGRGHILGKSRCGLCGLRSGLKAKCAAELCRARGERRACWVFHVSCARQAGYEANYDDQMENSFFVKCYDHGSNDFNVRARLEDLIEIERKRVGKKSGAMDAPMTFNHASRLLNQAILVMKILGWAWRWGEFWVANGSSWEPLLEPGQTEQNMTKEELKIVDSTPQSRCDDARRCRLGALGAALRNRNYDAEKGFNQDALTRALRALLHTKSLVGPLDDSEVDFFTEWLSRAYRSKSSLLGFGQDKIPVAKDHFCVHIDDKTPKYILGSRPLPGLNKLDDDQVFEPVVAEPDDFLKPEIGEDGAELDLSSLFDKKTPIPPSLKKSAKKKRRKSDDDSGVKGSLRREAARTTDSEISNTIRAATEENKAITIETDTTKIDDDIHKRSDDGNNNSGDSKNDSNKGDKGDNSGDPDEESKKGNASDNGKGQDEHKETGIDDNSNNGRSDEAKSTTTMLDADLQTQTDETKQESKSGASLDVDDENSLSEVLIDRAKQSALKKKRRLSETLKIINDRCFEIAEDAVDEGPTWQIGEILEAITIVSIPKRKGRPPKYPKMLVSRMTVNVSYSDAPYVEPPEKVGEQDQSTDSNSDVTEPSTRTSRVAPPNRIRRKAAKVKALKPTFLKRSMQHCRTTTIGPKALSRKKPKMLFVESSSIKKYVDFEASERTHIQKKQQGAKKRLSDYFRESPKRVVMGIAAMENAESVGSSISPRRARHRQVSYEEPDSDIDISYSEEPPLPTVPAILPTLPLKARSKAKKRERENAKADSDSYVPPKLGPKRTRRSRDVGPVITSLPSPSHSEDRKSGSHEDTVVVDLTSAKEINESSPLTQLFRRRRNAEDAALAKAASEMYIKMMDGPTNAPELIDPSLTATTPKKMARMKGKAEACRTMFSKSGS